MKNTWLSHLLITIIILAICSESQARTIKGKVTCGRENLYGVIVTDGKNFTKTGRTGKFRMEISDSCRFVYIVTPSGYAGDWSDGSPKFYEKAEGKKYFSFELIKTGDATAGYNLIALGDPQPRTEMQADEFAREPLEDICSTDRF